MRQFLTNHVSCFGFGVTGGTIAQIEMPHSVSVVDAVIKLLPVVVGAIPTIIHLFDRKKVKQQQQVQVNNISDTTK